MALPVAEVTNIVCYSAVNGLFFVSITVHYTRNDKEKEQLYGRSPVCFPGRAKQAVPEGFQTARYLFSVYCLQSEIFYLRPTNIFFKCKTYTLPQK